MKYLLLLLLITLFQPISAQILGTDKAGTPMRVIRFADSLTLDQERIWRQTDGAQFTKVGDNCFSGMEITFFRKDNQARIRECHEGEWKEFEYTFEVVIESAEHHIKFYTRENYLLFFKRQIEVANFRIEAQMFEDTFDNRYTELNYFSLRDKTTRILRSKDN